MKKTLYRIAAGALSLVLLGTAVPVHVKAEENTRILENLLKEDKSSQTVYVIADNEGTAEKVLVSTNKSNAAHYEDKDSLPVKIKVTYKLDDKEISPNELAGKSGKINIRFDYENTTSATATLDGKTENVHIPFAVTTVMILNDDFKDVKVTNAKIVDDGNHALLVGMAYPSLAEDLKINPDKLNLYDYIELEANVSNAKIDNTYSIVTNTVFSSLSAANDIADDSALSGLMDGIVQLSAGSAELAQGLEALDAGIGELSNGMAALGNGLNKLSANSQSLRDGAKQVFNTLLNTANNTISQSGAGLPALTVDNYSQILTMAIQGLKLKGDAKTAAALSGLKAQLDSYNTFYQGLIAYTTGVDQATGGAKKINNALPELSNGSAALKDGARALADGLGSVNDNTVDKLTNSEDGDLTAVFERFKSLSAVAKDYYAYTNDVTDKDTHVRFIYKMKGVK